MKLKNYSYNWIKTSSASLRRERILPRWERNRKMRCRECFKHQAPCRFAVRDHSCCLFVGMAAALKVRNVTAVRASPDRRFQYIRSRQCVADSSRHWIYMGQQGP